MPVLLPAPALEVVPRAPRARARRAPAHGRRRRLDPRRLRRGAASRRSTTVAACARRARDAGDADRAREEAPSLAICRGVQVLNVALGGSLHQDVATDPGTEIQHSQKEARDQTTHKVTVAAGSRLSTRAGRRGPRGQQLPPPGHQVARPRPRPVAWAPDQADRRRRARRRLAVRARRPVASRAPRRQSEPARRLFSRPRHRPPARERAARRPEDLHAQDAAAPDS